MSRFHDLAQRVEALEIAASDACLEAMLVLHPASGATFVEIAGGRAFYFGPMSPLSQALGVGMQGPVEAAEFDRLEAFYLSRGSPVAISLCPHAHPSVLEHLFQRRYRIAHFEHVLERELTGEEAFLAPCQSIVRPALRHEASAWTRTVIEGFQGDMSNPEDLEELLDVMFAAPGSTAYLALQDGRAAAAGAISVCGDSALFYSDSTLSQFRRRGLQSALIGARLSRASALGCRTLIACTAPGSASQRNYERAGFRVAYTKTMVTSPL